LLDNTTKEIENIIDFNNKVSNGIKQEVLPTSAQSQQDKEKLMSVMGHLRDVKMIKDRTLNEIEPMKQTIMLLKKHQIKMEEDYLVKLENSKTALEDVSERALGTVREAILPLQTQEAGNINDKLRKFNIKVHDYRVEFQSKCPYHISNSSPEIIKTAYESIDLYYSKTCELELEASDLGNL